VATYWGEWLAMFGRRGGNEVERNSAWRSMAVYGGLWEFLEGNRQFGRGGVWRPMAPSGKGRPDWLCAVVKDDGPAGSNLNHSRTDLQGKSSDFLPLRPTDFVRPRGGRAWRGFPGACSKTRGAPGNARAPSGRRRPAWRDREPARQCVGGSGSGGTDGGAEGGGGTIDDR